MTNPLAWHWSGTRWELRPPDQRPGLSGIAAVAVVEKPEPTAEVPDPLWRWKYNGFEGGGYRESWHARWAVDGLIHEQRKEAKRGKA